MCSSSFEPQRAPITPTPAPAKRHRHAPPQHRASRCRAAWRRAQCGCRSRASLCDRVRHHAVQPDRRQHEREHGEHDQQQHREARTRDRRSHRVSRCWRPSPAGVIGSSCAMSARTFGDRVCVRARARTDRAHGVDRDRAAGMYNIGVPASAVRPPVNAFADHADDRLPLLLPVVHDAEAACRAPTWPGQYFFANPVVHDHLRAPRVVSVIVDPSEDLDAASCGSNSGPTPL